MTRTASTSLDQACDSDFTGIQVFLLKTFKIFILEIRVKMMLKLTGLWLGWQEGVNVVDVYCRILPWLWEMHFPATCE